MELTPLKNVSKGSARIASIKLCDFMIKSIANPHNTNNWDLLIDCVVYGPYFRPAVSMVQVDAKDLVVPSIHPTKHQDQMLSSYLRVEQVVKS